jgi:hypothetical protein
MKNDIDDHWMRPRTKAGTEEMCRRLGVLKEALNLASKGSFGDHLHVKFAQQIVKEYFTFDWENLDFEPEKQ